MSEKPTIDILSIDKIKPYGKNAKLHSKEQVSSLAKLIQRFGWTQPIVVDVDFVIIAGHGRRLAAIELGLQKVPVVVRRDLSKDEADALRLADNRAASVDYDSKAIQEELKRLFNADFDVAFTGFDESELDFLTRNELGDFNEDVFVEEIGEAVERQNIENEAKTAAVDESAAPIADAFGFKRLTVAQSRVVRSFMKRLEGRTGKTGVEALIAHIVELEAVA